MPYLDCSCAFCGISLTRYFQPQKLQKNVFCSKDCRKSWLSKNFAGELNPNFGKKWSKEKCKEHAAKIANTFTDERREKISQQHAGKVLSDETRKLMSNAKIGKRGISHTEEAKRKISEKSSAKFTLEFKQRLRKILELDGYWIPLDKKKQYQTYCVMSNWVKNIDMTQYVEIPGELLLLKQFHPQKNTKGFVRDHKFSRKSGFDEKVFPQLLRHPANLAFMPHADNVKKSRKKHVAHDSISLHQLFEQIQDYDKKWFEQSACLELIEAYRSGFRFSMENIEKTYANLVYE